MCVGGDGSGVEQLGLSPCLFLSCAPEGVLRGVCTHIDTQALAAIIWFHFKEKRGCSSLIGPSKLGWLRDPGSSGPFSANTVSPRV